MDLPTPRSNTNRIQMKQAIRNFLHQRLQIYKSRRSTKLLNACRPYNGIDPILWIPMSSTERSRCIHWRIGWLPGGKPKTCPLCNEPKGTNKRHLIKCLRMHKRLKVQETIEDPISWILNRIPKSRPRSPTSCNYWLSTWPEVCLILDELEHIQHPEYEPKSIYSDTLPGHHFIQWISRDPKPTTFSRSSGSALSTSC